MKKVALILSLSFISFFFLLSNLLFTAYAADASGSATPSALTTIDQKAQDLLNKVATKVAELSAKLQKSYHGQIKSLGDTSLVITTPQGNKTVATNDATNFYRIRAGNRTEINLTALKVGDDVGAVGIIDPVSTDLTARQIIAKIARTNVVGTIQAIDNTVVTVLPEDKSTLKIDLDGAALKQLDQSGKITTAKLANFKTNATIFAIAVSPDSTTGVYSVLKAMTLSQQ